VVTATGIPGRGYYGPADIHYTRCPLSNLEGLVTLYSTAAFTLDIICSQLNAQFNTFLDPSDFQTPTLPTLSPGQSGTATLVAAANSLGWKGQFDLTLSYGKPYLSTAIGSNHLATMTDALSNNPYGRLDGVQALWNFDFTSYRDALKPVLYGAPNWWQYWGFTDWGAVQNICQKIGIALFNAPQWNSQVNDYPTSQVANANKNFDRVVVLSPVLVGRYYGSSMYFHYNILENR
jgi:hypothetical protein